MTLLEIFITCVSGAITAVLIVSIFGYIRYKRNLWKFSIGDIIEGGPYNIVWEVHLRDEDRNRYTLKCDNEIYSFSKTYVESLYKLSPPKGRCINGR